MGSASGGAHARESPAGPESLQELRGVRVRVGIHARTRSGHEDWGVSDAPTPTTPADAVKAESRWGAALAILVAVPLQITLPDEVTPPLAWVFMGLALFLLVILLIVNPRRLSPEERQLRKLSIAVIACLAGANFVSLVALLKHLLDGDPYGGRALITAAAAVWATGVIVYGLLYWELDAGGPQVRATSDGRSVHNGKAVDFLFPQRQPDFDALIWHPRFVDYLYLSLTNAMAFGPTDTMPLSRISKVLMGTQSIMSLATIAVVGARAVGILS